MIRLHLLGALEFAASDGRDLHPLAAQPKRVAVLAYLAARPAGEFVRRDTLLGLFWPELDQAAARRSLRQALHVIRTHLGAESLNARGDEEVALNPAAVSCDVQEFLAAVAEGRLDEASEAYRGDLLGGFFLGGGAPAFEQWLESERQRLRALAAKSIWSLADAAERAGDRSGAAGWARRAAALTADDEVVLRRLLQLLLRVGDRAGALHAYNAFARRLARDFSEEPAAQTRALVAELGGIETPPPPPLAEPTRRRRRGWLVAASVGAGVLALGVGARTLLGRRAEPPVLAVSEVTRGDSSVPTLAVKTLPELLATDLAQVNGLSVISHPRLEEVGAQLQPAGQPAIAVARAAGADELLEGELYRRGPDSLRLDLRQVDAKTGVVRHALTLRGRDVFALADSAAAWFAGRYGLAPPTVGVAQATSTSLVAHGFYDEGLRAYYHEADYRAAQRLFEAALEQDTTFAIAAYYLGRSLETQGLNASAAFQRAARLAERQPGPDALYVRVWWPAAQNDPRFLVLAESLAARYPDEPAAQFAEGYGRSEAADYAGAIGPLRAAVRLDSLSLTTPTALRCVACDAYASLVQAYVNLDSLPAADRVSQEWVRRQPSSSLAWDYRALTLLRLDRTPDALNAQRIGGRLRGQAGESWIERVYAAVQRTDLAAAEALLNSSDADANGEARRSRVWWRVIMLRYAGRPRAAAVVARQLLVPEPDDSEHKPQWLPLGVALYEAGDLDAAAAAFDSAATAAPAYRRAHPGTIARRKSWTSALRGMVAFAQRDTAALRRLADTVAVYGPQSALGRDRLLRAYLRGLLLEAEHHSTAALDTLRVAAYSPTEGFTRVNVELARVLAEMGRWREAVYWLEAALRGGIEGSNLYVTRPEVREQLARTFAAAGQVDSARAQFAIVAHAWENAEPAYHDRRDSALAYLARTAHRP
ncbi:MAG TPA: BTAD domain-containing putative transcriptional regulator [Gemmatimonadales bacterium]|nr:BTAD domain-containing putative transcriptional regulator [Gemmatimonadales bacterium]